MAFLFRENRKSREGWMDGESATLNAASYGQLHNKSVMCL